MLICTLFEPSVYHPLSPSWQKATAQHTQVNQNYQNNNKSKKKEGLPTFTVGFKTNIAISSIKRWLVEEGYI